MVESITILTTLRVQLLATSGGYRDETGYDGMYSFYCNSAENEEVLGITPKHIVYTWTGSHKPMIGLPVTLLCNTAT